MIKKLFLLCLLLPTLLNAQNGEPIHTRIAFRKDNTILLKNYMSNATQLADIEQWIEANYRSADPVGGYLRIIGCYKDNTPQSINRAAIRVRTAASYFRTKSRDKEMRFTFLLNHAENGDELIIECLYGAIPEGENTQLTYTQSSDPTVIRSTVASFPQSAYINKEEASKRTMMPTEPILTSKIEQIAHSSILFRVDKSVIDPSYMNNKKSLTTLSDMLTSNDLKYIDSLKIIALTSPEAPLNYNIALSQRRAQSLHAYLKEHFPMIRPKHVTALGLGENWEDLKNMAMNDPNLPSRHQVLELLDNPMDEDEKEIELKKLDGGSTYRYIYSNYYSHLRVGASLIMTVNQELAFPKPLLLPPIQPLSVSSSELFPLHVPSAPIKTDTFRYIRPIAIKTNMLFDLLTLFNVEIEVPIGKQFSVLGEWTFPFWGGLGNAGGVAPIPAYSESYTLQMLSGMVEGRYWFRRSEKLDKRARTWGDYNPLNGWFVGLFGGAGLYDAQIGKHGMQGEFYIASGVSFGYAHPIAKNLHMEYSVGVGYIATRYYNYTVMGGHKVVDIREDGKYDRRQQSLIGPTRLKVSLVWIPQFKVKKKTEVKP